MRKQFKKLKRTEKDWKQNIVILGIVFVVTIILFLFFPSKREVMIVTFEKFFIEMISILPAVLILMGLFTVFISKKMVMRYLGEAAGIKAIFLGILMGALPTGPLYIAFPIASVLLKKGVRVASVVSFLSAWACIKIPQEMVELQFLGFKFMALRLFLTIIFVIIMGIFIEWAVKLTNQK